MHKVAARLGDILVEAGLIDQDQLESALTSQKETKMPIGQILVKMGAVTQDDINWALSGQLNISYLRVTPSMLDKNLVKSVPENILREYNMIPIMKIGPEISVAMADPTRSEAIYAIEKATGCQAKVCISPAKNIEEMLDTIFGEKSPELNPLREMEDLITVSNNKTRVQKILQEALEEELPHVRFIIHFNPLRIDYHYGTKTETLPNTEGLKEDLDYLESFAFKEHQNSYPGLGHVILQTEGGTTHEAEISFFHTIDGEACQINFPEFKDNIPSLNKLGLSTLAEDFIHTFLNKGHGALLVCGETEAARLFGYSLLKENISTSKIVVSIEEKVSHRLHNVLQFQLENNVYDMTLFDAINLACKNQPDMLMVSDITQPDEVETLLDGALEGMLVIGQVPSYRAMALKNKFEMAFPLKIHPGLAAIAAVKSVKRLCHYCRQHADLSPKEQEFMRKWGIEAETGLKHTGCPRCHNTGYRGVRYLVEVLPIESCPLLPSSINMGSIYEPFEKQIARKIQQGEFSVEELAPYLEGN